MTRGSDLRPSGSGVIRVLYVDHTALVGGAEHSLLTLLEQRPEGYLPVWPTLLGPPAEAVSDLGYPTLSLPETIPPAPRRRGGTRRVRARAQGAQTLTAPAP